SGRRRSLQTAGDPSQAPPLHPSRPSSPTSPPSLAYIHAHGPAFGSAEHFALRAEVPGEEGEEAALPRGKSLRQAAAEMEWLNEYEKLVIRMDTPKVVIDNAVCPTATLVQVDSARKRGVLLEAVQVLADLDLSINKAYISSDGRWFMDVFHVTDRLGRKLTDDSVITYIQQVGEGESFSPSWPRRSGKGAAFLIRFLDLAAVYRDLERAVEAGGARGANGA
uniref:ACT domain-containing protein ACR n=1 Tax=Aegilops tauschii subsp. strangulata TaxID=200361 RepID=A0A453S184_AEGTS